MRTTICALTICGLVLVVGAASGHDCPNSENRLTTNSARGEMSYQRCMNTCEYWLSYLTCHKRCKHLQ